MWPWIVIFSIACLDVVLHLDNHMNGNFNFKWGTEAFDFVIMNVDRCIFTNVTTCIEIYISLYFLIVKMPRSSSYTQDTATVEEMLVSCRSCVLVGRHLVPNMDLPNWLFLAKVRARLPSLSISCVYHTWIRQTYDMRKRRIPAAWGHGYLILHHLDYIFHFVIMWD